MSPAGLKAVFRCIPGPRCDGREPCGYCVSSKTDPPCVMASLKSGLQVVIVALALLCGLLLPTIYMGRHILPLPPIPRQRQSSGKADLNVSVTFAVDSSANISLHNCGDSCDAFETCNGKSLRGGYVLVLKNWEQLTSGTGNLMSLQCWAATMNMVVVEYFMKSSMYGVPDSLIANSITATPSDKFIRLGQIFDLEDWNTFSKRKCYAPLVQWERFLSSAPREVIFLHVVYSNMPNDHCPPKANTGKVGELGQKYFPFFYAHGFKIIREVCIDFRTNKFSTDSFNSYILGSYRTNKVTVMFDMWRGTENPHPKGHRVSLNDTRCGIGQYRSLSFSKPSRKILEDVQLYRERIMSNKDYVAVVVRYEHALRLVLSTDNWTMDKCFKAVVTSWRALMKESGLDESFWSLDVGEYGSVGYEIVKRIRMAPRQIISLMKEHLNISYLDVEESLTNISGIANSGYIASLQLNIAVRAKCLLLIGGGSYHARAKLMYMSLHNRRSYCIVVRSKQWLKERCRE